MSWPDARGGPARFVAVERRVRPCARLFFFPHAGGGPSAGSVLRDLLPPHIEPWVVSLPGRQGRQDEPPATDLDSVGGAPRSAPARPASRHSKSVGGGTMRSGVRPIGLSRRGSLPTTPVA